MKNIYFLVACRGYQFPKVNVDTFFLHCNLNPKSRHQNSHISIMNIPVKFFSFNFTPVILLAVLPRAALHVSLRQVLRARLRPLEYQFRHPSAKLSTGKFASNP